MGPKSPCALIQRFQVAARLSAPSPVDIKLLCMNSRHRAAHGQGFIQHFQGVLAFVCIPGAVCRIITPAITYTCCSLGQVEISPWPVLNYSPMRRTGALSLVGTLSEPTLWNNGFLHFKAKRIHILSVQINNDHLFSTNQKAKTDKKEERERGRKNNNKKQACLCK